MNTNDKIDAQPEQRPVAVAERAVETPVATTETEYVVLAPTERRRPRAVVVGAGFGGLNAAKELVKHDVDVLLLDRNNYHGFWPLLYQVATAGLEPESIAYPVRAILRDHRNADFQMAEVRGVDFENKRVLTDGAAIDYDYLILAAGSANNYFGNDALARSTFGMKDIDEAETLRNHVLASFERAVRETDDERRQALLTFVIVGGGPTGVELAGAFAELIGHVLKRDYPTLDVKSARVVLVEATDRILATFPQRLQRNAQRKLGKMGVDVRLNTAVASVEGERARFKDGTELAAATVVWAAGVRAAALTDSLKVQHGRSARVLVESTLNLHDRPEVFVVGDMAYLEGFKSSSAAYPMVAQVAIQQGKRAAKNIAAQVAGKPMQPFSYFDFGSMATIGRSSAVFDAFNIRLVGLLAWLGWLFIHLLYLIGFRNRVVVVANWLYNYLTYDRGIRIITRREGVEM